jgi:dTDP-4-dehydrorhamnose 3,5-epimerase-like enzyme
MYGESMSRLDEIRLIELPSVKDSRGILTSVEGGNDIPFAIKRVFHMHHIVSDRGGHAHIDTDQLIVASSGRFQVEFSDGTDVKRYVLDDPTRGLYVPRLIFIRLYAFSEGAVCMVLASTHYDIGKSIRSWDDYQKFIGKSK